MTPKQGESPPNSSETPQCDGCDLSCAADCPVCDICGDPIHAYGHGAPAVFWAPRTFGPKEYTTHRACKPRFAWVNAYEVTRHYGGREEGGWWFNQGEPLASLPILLEEDPKPHVERLRELFSHVNEGDIYSSRGGSELDITVELKPAAYWPAERPRYE